MTDPDVHDDSPDSVAEIKRKLAALEGEIASGDRRRSLVALRDYLAHELSGHRCKACMMSQLRTGDTAALVLRLTKIIEEIAALPDADAELSPVEKIRRRRDDAGEADVIPLSRAAGMGTKSGPRQQGGRTPRHKARD